MDIEGKYTLPNGEVLEVFVNVAVKRQRTNGEFSFRRYGLSDFLSELEIAKSDGNVTFEPKERKVDE